MKLFTAIDGPQTMAPTHFGDLLTFLPAAPAGESFHSPGEISKHPLDGKFDTDI